MAERGLPGRWHTREDSGLVLDRDLVWWHDGVRIEHPRIVEAFNGGLVPTEDGRFQLRIGADWAYVTVEDAAYRVTAVDVGDARVFLRLSDRTGEALDPATLALDADGVLRARVKGGRAAARFSRDAQFALGEILVRAEERVALALGDRQVPTSLPVALLG